MNKQKHKQENELETTLRAIEQSGIVVDSQNLIRDMCAQFSDPREWIREYVVNAFDAHASLCWVSGREDDETVTIVVEDNGHGMGRQGIVDYFKVYRSVKAGDTSRTVGRHGIGKLSVAAIPGQCGFMIATSTGTEAWKAQTGALLDQAPIQIEQVQPVPAQGTRFEITFRKSHSLAEELRFLALILDRYLRYLPFTTIICESDGHDVKALEDSKWIQGNWFTQSGTGAEQRYRFTVGGSDYDAVFSVGKGEHEIYQNRVMVTGRYNLLSFGSKTELVIPGLSIRVDSRDFELPFGRHCLCNEDVLKPLATELKTRILPRYFDVLADIYDSGTQSEYGIEASEIEAIATGLMAHDPLPRRRWCNLAMFNSRNRSRLSLNALRECVEKTGILYLDNETLPGVDYEQFVSPVLHAHQPTARLELVAEIFKDKLVNIGALDTVIMEAPESPDTRIGPKEIRFQNLLGLHPDVFRKPASENQRSPKPGAKGVNLLSLVGRSSSVPGSDDSASDTGPGADDLELLQWKVNYLVEGDGRTPCTTRRFLYRDNQVVLNLHYPEIRSLMALSETIPALAGHWALAMCLCEDTTILPHLTPQERENLMVKDAIAKCGSLYLPGNPDTRGGLDEDTVASRLEFEKDIEAFDLWLK